MKVVFVIALVSLIGLGNRNYIFKKLVQDFQKYYIAATSLKCWRCTSDSSNGAFCDDPFDPSLIDEQVSSISDAIIAITIWIPRFLQKQRRWAYVECSFPSGISQFGTASGGRPVCKKMAQSGMLSARAMMKNSDFLIIHSQWQNSSFSLMPLGRGWHSPRCMPSPAYAELHRNQILPNMYRRWL